MTFDPLAWMDRTAEEQAIIDQEVEDRIALFEGILARVNPGLPRQMSFEMEGGNDGISTDAARYNEET